MVRVCLAAVICISCFVSLLLGQTAPATYVIYGRVSLPDGPPAARVKIVITNQRGYERQAFSDDTGRYEIPDVPRDRYFLSALNPSAPEQYSERQELDLTRVFSTMVMANLYMRGSTKMVPARENASAGVSVKEAAQQIPRAALKEFEKGVKLGEAQNLAKALQSFDRSIELFPEYFQAFTERGLLRVAMSNISEAKQDFARALDINARYEPAMRGIGVCKLREGNFTGAIKDLESAVSNEPRDAMAHLFLGFANAALDRRQEGRAALQKALSLDPRGTARAHVHLANLWIKENMPGEAIKEIQAYLEVVPNPPDAEKLRSLIAQLRARLIQ